MHHTGGCHNTLPCYTGLLDETLVVVLSEMGRTPKLNADGGRDHWTNCYSVMLSGLIPDVPEFAAGTNVTGSGRSSEEVRPVLIQPAERHRRAFDFRWQRNFHPLLNASHVDF